VRGAAARRRATVTKRRFRHGAVAPLRGQEIGELAGRHRQPTVATAVSVGDGACVSTMARRARCRATVNKRKYRQMTRSASFRWSRFAAVAATVLIVGVYPILASQAHRIDEVHYELICDGMSLDTVQNVFGVSPGDYDGAKDADFFYSRVNEVTLNARRWTSHHGSYIIVFDPDTETGTVVSTRRSTWSRPTWQEQFLRFAREIWSWRSPP
jgi:hypothetical protein